MEPLPVGLVSKAKLSSFPPPITASIATGVPRMRTVGSCNTNKYYYCSMRLQLRPLSHRPSKYLDERVSHRTKYLANAASANTNGYVGPDHPMGPLKALDIVHRFSRPYAALGTILLALSVCFLAVEKLSDFSPLLFTKILLTTAAAYLMQIYISGVNQLSDIEIDKVNKPYLPLAAGEISVKTGVMMVSSSVIMSFMLARIVGSWPLFWALLLLFVLGTGYSIDLPLLRWKRFPITAMLYILSTRAFVFPVALYVHAQTNMLGRPAVLSKHTIFAAAMLAVFSITIIFFKDIPDIEGDQRHGIKSLASRMGPKRMFWSCVWFLQMAYGIAIVMGASSSFPWSKYITVLGHSATSVILWTRANSVDVKSKSAIQSFYMFVWQLLYVENLLIPLVR